LSLLANYRLRAIRPEEGAGELYRQTGLLVNKKDLPLSLGGGGKGEGGTPGGLG
jgi:hypothetical protein